MTDPVTLSIDAMSGDHGHSVAVKAARLALAEHPELSLILCGDEAQLKASLAANKLGGDRRLTVQHASEVVEMDELPSKALRGKKVIETAVAAEPEAEGQ